MFKKVLPLLHFTFSLFFSGPVPVCIVNDIFHIVRYVCDSIKLLKSFDFLTKLKILFCFGFFQMSKWLEVITLLFNFNGKPTCAESKKILLSLLKKFLDLKICMFYCEFFVVTKTFINKISEVFKKNHNIFLSKKNLYNNISMYIHVDIHYRLIFNYIF